MAGFRWGRLVKARFPYAFTNIKCLKSKTYLVASTPNCLKRMTYMAAPTPNCLERKTYMVASGCAGLFGGGGKAESGVGGRHTPVLLDIWKEQLSKADRVLGWLGRGLF